jgi:Tfp pilus assembly protein PilN
MIRINLLGVAPPPGAKAPAPPTTTMRMGMILGVALVASFLVVGIFYKVWSATVAGLERDLKKERDREADLKGVEAQNLRYQAHLRELETRINTIQTLQNSRTGPVELMSALGATVSRTSDVYLLSVSPAGTRLDVRGESNSVESIAALIAALKQVSSFDDVQLRQYFQDDLNQRLAFKFNLDFVYKPPQPPVQNPAPAMQPGMTPGNFTRRTGM